MTYDTVNPDHIIMDTGLLPSYSHVPVLNFDISQFINITNTAGPSLARTLAWKNIIPSLDIQAPNHNKCNEIHGHHGIH